MGTDPQDLVDQAVEAAERSTRLNATVAVTVAVLATFMGICKVKDDNIVQAMQQAQADKIDHWAYYQAIARYRQLAADQSQKKEALRGQAEDDQRHYDALNFRDDQFDLCDALLAIAIAMLAVTALTQLWPLYFMALVPTGFGVLMGLAGLLGWAIHPTALVSLLS